MGCRDARGVFRSENSHEAIESGSLQCLRTVRFSDLLSFLTIPPKKSWKVPVEAGGAWSTNLTQWLSSKQGDPRSWPGQGRSFPLFLRFQLSQGISGVSSLYLSHPVTVPWHPVLCKDFALHSLLNSKLLRLDLSCWPKEECHQR